MRDRGGSSLAHSVYTNYTAGLLRAFPRHVCVCECVRMQGTHTHTHFYSTILQIQIPNYLQAHLASQMSLSQEEFGIHATISVFVAFGVKKIMQIASPAIGPLGSMVTTFSESQYISCTFHLC